MKKLASAVLAMILILALVGCGGTSGSAASGTAITILMGKGEVGSQFEKMLEIYSEKAGVTVSMIPLAGQDAYEKMTSLYASGNAPSILMVGQEFEEFKDKFLDLSTTSFVGKSSEGTLERVTVGDEILGTPVTVEAYGIIYNPDTVAPILGEDFDPSSIKTQDELDDFFSDLTAGGVGAFTLSPMDWSLGAHLSNTLYTAQSETHEGRLQFIEDLKVGKINLAENDVFNGWVKTLDILLKHNIHNDSPLSAVYEDGSLELATGDAAAWFMGNWAYPELATLQEAKYKFIPIPVSNNANDYANGKIAVGVPSYWCVDKSGNSEEQQQASVDFLKWFIETEEGQDYYVNQMNFIPCYSGFEVEPSDSMSLQIADMLKNGENLEWMNNYYPAGGFQVMGAAMQKYIDNVIDKTGLASEFEEYWKSVA